MRWVKEMMLLQHVLHGRLSNQLVVMVMGVMDESRRTLVMFVLV